MFLGYPFDDENVNKEYVANYIAWQKEFVAGNQNSYANPCNGKLCEENKQFYWQEYSVFNLLKPTVDKWANEYDENKIWGINNAVDQLIPYQKQYNRLMNSIKELTNKVAAPILCVEDGSVDADELGEEGLAPGKIIIYRQGSQAPTQITPTATEVASLYGVALGVKAELIQLMEDLEENF